MKRIYIVMLFAALATITYAQTDDKGYQEGAWVLKGVTGLNMSQTAMANWSAGGENSIAGNAYLNASLTHKKGNWLWVTNMVLDYGLSKTKSQGMRKSSDKIGLSTQLGYSTDNVWFYTLMGDLNTQFAKGYDYPDKEHQISKIFAVRSKEISRSNQIHILHHGQFSTGFHKSATLYLEVVTRVYTKSTQIGKIVISHESHLGGNG